MPLPRGLTRVRSRMASSSARDTAMAYIPMFLRREPTWRQETLRKLDFPKSMMGGKQANSVYWDSIPSFTKALRQGKLPVLHHVLDSVVNRGLADDTLIQRYRKFGDVREKDKLDALHKDIKNVSSKLASLEKKYQRTKQAIEQLQQQHAASNDSTEQASGMFSGSFLNLDRTEVREKQLKRRMEDLDYLQTAIKESQSKLQVLRTQLEEQTTVPLTDQETSAIQQLMGDVKKDVVDVFTEHVRSRHSKMLEQYKKLDERTDMTTPQIWYPRTRLSRRKVVYHGGPTNSGKTFEALERLKQAKKGMYLGPLRLLAAEIYEKLTVDGIYCNLYTGQEVREIPFATHGAATVEMALTNEEYEVVVLDEIQMIEDSERGFAWTRALLGSQCQELHVCGGLEAEAVVRKLVEACGDEFELRTYERFTPLRVAEKSLAEAPDQKGSYKDVQPGDCVVAFSRDDIFAIKREIETTTKYKCCVIYGSLPPSTRSEMARSFNDPDSGYDILVASDAISMGLNLSIKRIVFNSIYKNNGYEFVRLGQSAIKQISGRAGRRNSPFPVGEVTTRDPRDLEYVRECMSSEIPPVQQVGLLPTANHIETFSKTLEEMGLGHGPKNFHKVLQQFNQLSTVKGDYFVCRQRGMIDIAKRLSGLDLNVPDKYVLCLSPVNTRHSSSMSLVNKFATKLANGEVPGLNHHTIPKRARNFADLARLCLIFSELDLFLWLQKKFPPGNLMEQHSAHSRREMVVQFIAEGLQMVRLNPSVTTRTHHLERQAETQSLLRKT